LMKARKVDEARTRFQQALRIDPSDARTDVEVATCFGLQGRFAEALPYYQRAFELEPKWITLLNLNHEYGVMLIGAGQASKAREVYGRAVAEPEVAARGLRSLALLDMYEGRYREAISRLRQAVILNQAKKEVDPEARDHLYAAQAFDALGENNKRLHELDEAARGLGQEHWLTLESRVGVEYARAGALGKASKMLEAVRGEGDAKSPDDNGDLHWLEGEIEVARGNFSSGIGKLELARRETATSEVGVQDGLARALEKLGKVPEAIAAYEAVLADKGGWLGWEPQQLWLADHVQLARIYASHGEKEKARKVLDELLGLWGQADADMPLLHDAQQLRAQVLQ